MIPIEEFDDAVRKELGFLAGLGYSYHRPVLGNTAALGQYLEARYENARKSRGIRVWFADSGPLKPAIVIFLENGPDTFALGEYLRHVGAPQSSVEPLSLKWHSEMGHARIVRVLRHAAELMQCELAAVVRGEAWQHVPIDWQGQK